MAFPVIAATSTLKQGAHLLGGTIVFTPASDGLGTVSSGDMLWVVLAASNVGSPLPDAAPNWTPPSGFTNTGTTAAHDADSTFTNIVGKSYWKIAGGSEPSSYTFTISQPSPQTAGGDGGYVAVMFRITGADQVTPIPQSTAAGSVNNGVNVSKTIAVPTYGAAKDRLMCYILVATNSAAGAISSAPPGTVTERVDQTRSGTYSNAFLTIATKTSAVSGNPGSESFTLTNGADLAEGHLGLGIEPGAAADTGSGALAITADAVVSFTGGANEFADTLPLTITSGVAISGFFSDAPPTPVIDLLHRNPDAIGCATYTVALQNRGGARPVANPPLGETLYVVGSPPGLLTTGTLDLLHRPIVVDPDGGYSTVRSITIDDGGVFVLLPTVIGNRIVGNQEAINHYTATGDHLGKFSTEIAADTYAITLHEEQAEVYALGIRLDRRYIEIPFTSLQFSRVLNAAGSASISLGPECCSEIFAYANPWQDEVVIYRNHEVAFVGPLVSLQTGLNGGSLSAKDLYAWMDVRFIENDLHFDTDVATIFKGIFLEALNADPSPNISISTRETGVRAQRDIKGTDFQPASSLLRNLSSTALDFTVIGRKVLAGGLEVFLSPTPLVLHDDAVQGSAEVTKDGSALATDVAVFGANEKAENLPITGRATRAVQKYGLVQRVVTELLTEDTTSANANALARLESMLPNPLRVSASLTPEAGFPFTELIPGKRMDVRLKNGPGCVEVMQDMRLVSVNVSYGVGESGSSEKVLINLSPLGVTDAG